MVTRKTRFRLWVTTSPQDIGYGNTTPETPWQDRAVKGWTPDCRGTVKTLLEKFKIYKMDAGLTGGIFYSYHIIDTSGRVFSLDEIQSLYYSLYKDWI